MRTTIFLMKRWPLAPQNENKVPFREKLPLQLKNKVSSKGSRQNESKSDHGREWNKTLCATRDESRFFPRLITAPRYIIYYFLTSVSLQHEPEERGCLYEISLVLACLQKNNFENQFCTKEVTSFHQCYINYLHNKRTAKEDARKGILTPNSKNLKHNQINILMRKYPHV